MVVSRPLVQGALDLISSHLAGGLRRSTYALLLSARLLTAAQSPAHSPCCDTASAAAQASPPPPLPGVATNQRQLVVGIGARPPVYHGGFQPRSAVMLPAMAPHAGRGQTDGAVSPAAAVRELWGQLLAVSDG